MSSVRPSWLIATLLKKVCQDWGIPRGPVQSGHRHISCTNCSILNVYSTTTTATKSLQSCPTLLDPRDGSPPGSPIPGILQARTLEWVAISFCSAWKWNVKLKSLSRVQPSATPWTAGFQAPPSMGFSRQEYWSGCQYFSVIISVKKERYGTSELAETSHCPLFRVSHFHQWARRDPPV